MNASLALKPPVVAYADYIAARIRADLYRRDPEGIIDSVGRVQHDLDDAGAFVSPRKTLLVEDRNGKQYLITVEEVAP